MGGLLPAGAHGLEQAADDDDSFLNESIAMHTERAAAAVRQREQLPCASGG